MRLKPFAFVLACVSLAFALFALWKVQPEPPRATAPADRVSMLAPPGYSIPEPAPPAWEANAARNSRDLYAAFEQARERNDPVAWLVAADIAGACTNALSVGLRDRMTGELGDYNSTKAGAPDRTARLASLERQKAALVELQQRCQGFSANPSTENAALVAKAKASDSVLGRLLRAQDAAHEGDASEWLPAVTAALASGNPVVTRIALYGFAQVLYEPAPNAPEPFSAFGALLRAHARVAGDEFDRNEMEALGACAMVGWCGLPNSTTPLPADWSAQNKARYENLVQQYEQALRNNDVKAIVAAKPS